MKMRAAAWLGITVSRIRDWPFWALPGTVRAYVIAVSAGAAAVLGIAAADTHWRMAQLAVFLPLLACGVVAIEATRNVAEPHGTVVRDMQAVWFVAIAVLLPPVYTLLAPIPLTSYKLLRAHGMVAHRRVFSTAAIGLGYGSASAAFHRLPVTIAGTAPGTGSHAVTWAAAVIVAGAVGWTINTGLIALAITLSDREARIPSLMFSRESLSSDLVELGFGALAAVVTALEPVLLLCAVPSVLLQRRFLMHAQLVNDARTDAKTGLLNATTWQREADVELSRAVRTRTPLALAVLDLDHFKLINDTFGHLTGDRVLREVADALKEHMREYDLVGRFGGEEFTILFPHTTAVQAKYIAERLRTRIAGLPVADEDGVLGAHITASIGIATLVDSHRDLNDLIAAADNAVYKAKQNGRNKVHILTDGSEAAPAG
jgi:diguanylate cyclase (GGDEF)-like protein